MNQEFRDLFEAFPLWTVGEFSSQTMSRDALDDQEECYARMKNRIKHFTVHLRRTFELVGKGVQVNNEATFDVRYISNHISCHDSRIDYLERNLKELMRMMDIINDKVLKMAKMTQCNHFQEFPYDGICLVEEATVTQHAFRLAGKNKQQLCPSPGFLIFFFVFC